MATDFIGGIVKRAKAGGESKAPPADDAESKGAGDDETTEPEGYEGIEDSAISDLAKVLKVSDRDLDTFRSALGDYVEACVRKRLDEGADSKAAD